MATANGDRNLLFGILALQMDFVGRDALVKAMNAWVLDKARTLGEILLEQKALGGECHALLEALVQEHLKQHGGDAEKSLAAVSTVGSVRQDLRQIADPDVQASLSHVRAAADPLATRPPSVGAPSAVGRRFRVLRPHAEGGLGAVFVAHDEELHREVALKEIQERHADHPESRARFLVEAEITGGLEHPGIVPVYGLGTYDDGRPFYAMRFIKGDSLKDAIDRFHKEDAKRPAASARSLELRKLLGRFVDVCEAIAYAHSRGVLHRDLKPGNVMLGKYGETLVVDWGLAKPVGGVASNETEAEGPLWPASADNSAPTQMGTAIGTPPFMSPEQAAGRIDQLGPASDVYSLGATLYCLLTGRVPFEGGDVGTVLQRVQRGDFPRPRQAKRDVHPPLEAVCLKAMALRPEDRYATPRGLAGDIEKWLADEPVGAWREPWRVRVGRWVRRHQTMTAAAAAGVIVALLVGGSGAFWYQQDRAARAAATGRDVTAALGEAETLGKQAKTLTDDPVHWEAALSEALSAVKRAEGLLNSGQGADELRGRVAALREELEAADKDRRMVARLEEARLQGTGSGKQGGFDYVGEAEQHAAAFEEDMQFSSLSTDQAAEAVNKRAIRDELLAALAHWSNITSNQEVQQRLRGILKAADPDVGAFRNRWNAAMAQQDLNSLRQLAFGPEAGIQPAVRLALLGNQLEQLNAKDAVKFLRAANERRPGDFWILFELGRACDESTPPLTEDGVRYYTAALALRPNNSVAHDNLGWALYNQGKLEEAEKEYRLSLQLQDNADARTNLGLLLYDQGKRIEAEKDYRRALELDPAHAWAHNNMGVVLQDQGKSDEAVAEYRRAVQLKPLYLKPHINLGKALYQQRKLDEAAAEYRKAVELDPKGAAAHDGLGNILRDQGKPEEATAEYRTALQLDPKDADAHTGLGNLLYDQGKSEEAAVEYRTAIQLNPKEAAPHNNLGNVLHDQGKPEEATAEYRVALQLDPKFASAHTGLGIILHDQGKREEAAAEYRTAIQLDPKEPAPHNDLGNILRDQGKYEDAAAEYRTALQIDPKSAYAHNGLGDLLRDQGKQEEATAEYRAALLIDPKDVYAHNYLGDILHNQGKPEEAAAEYRAALLIDPKNVYAHDGLGDALHDQGKQEEAAAEYRAALQINPKSAYAHKSLGDALRDQGKYEEATAEYRAALQIDPEDAYPHNGLGDVLHDQGKQEEAAAEYRSALQINPKSAYAHKSLGDALRDQGKYEEATAEYRAAIQIDPKDAYPHNGLGDVLHDQGKPEAAAAEYRAALQIDPKDAYSHDKLGDLLRDQGKPEEAAAEYHAALQIDPKDVYAHNYLGDVLQEQGKPEEAAAEYRAALQIDAKNAYAHEGLGDVQRGQGRQEDAAAEYRAAIQLDPKNASAHNSLGRALSASGKRPESVAEFRKAIELDPKYVWPHINLGDILSQDGKPEEAAAEYRAAIEIDPVYAQAHYDLGKVLDMQGKPEAAAAEFRKAIELQPKDVNTHIDLGNVLYNQGKLEEASAEFSLAQTLVGALAANLPAAGALREIISQRVHQCEQMIALDKRLSAILKGDAQPSDAAEQIRLAELCRLKTRHAAAARFYADAFAAKPALADDVQAAHRYAAACAAALAGAGQGGDADKLEDMERSRLRRQALDWLRADLAAWDKQAGSGTPQAQATVRKKLQHWQEDADLAGLRDADALDKLPEAERAAWKKLWADVDALLKKTAEGAQK